MVFFEFWLGSHGMSLQPIFVDIFRTSSTLQDLSMYVIFFKTIFRFEDIKVQK